MTEITMTRDDLTVIRASAKRIAEIASNIAQSETQRGLTVEAAAIITLIENQLRKAS